MRLSTPTGLPDWISSDSSSSRSVSAFTIASKHSRLRARAADAAVDDDSFGFSATSDRVVLDHRSGASVSQDFAVRAVPRGARITRSAKRVPRAGLASGF
jgi:hypothetical protein